MKKNTNTLLLWLRDQRGFSLIELLLVFLVAGILMSFVIWMAQKAPNEAHLNGARNILSLALTQLRQNPLSLEHNDIGSKGLEAPNRALWQCAGLSLVKCGTLGVPSSGPYVFSIIHKDGAFYLRIGARKGESNDQGVFSYAEAESLQGATSEEIIKGAGAKECAPGNGAKGCIVEILL